MIQLSKELMHSFVSAAVQPMKPYYQLTPGKHYHTLQHIQNMLEFCLEHADTLGKLYPVLTAADGFKQLITAILWHDADYRPGDQGNEIRAAALYMEHNGKDADIVVGKAVLSTMIGNSTFNNAVELVLHDLDYSNFLDEIKMAEAEEQLYQEYLDTVHPDGSDPTLEDRRDFLKRQRAFYHTMCGPCIFVSLFAEHDEQAQVNVAKRIDSLSDAIKLCEEAIATCSNGPF
jgi:predicted metal-dependent HD superfamily phosphohydrolase